MPSWSYATAVVAFSLLAPASFVATSRHAAASECPEGKGSITGTGSGEDVVYEGERTDPNCNPSSTPRPTSTLNPVRPITLPESIIDRVRVSACVTGPPDINGKFPENVDMCSYGSDTCNDETTLPNERRWYFRVWERTRSGPPDYTEIGAWEPAGFACFRPEDLPSDTVDVVRRQVTWVDVYNAVRNEKAAQKRVTIQPAGRTLVNADTIVYTSKDKWTKYGIDLLGFKVDVEGTPTGYKWDFGDGQTLTTKSAGKPYPAKDVTHKYMKRADQLGVSVTTTYEAKFRVDGGAWQTIEQPLTVTGPTTALDVREAIPVLVDPGE